MNIHFVYSKHVVWRLFWQGIFEFAPSVYILVSLHYYYLFGVYKIILVQSLDVFFSDLYLVTLCLSGTWAVNNVTNRLLTIL
jgi:hypothetical protein